MSFSPDKIQTAPTPRAPLIILYAPNGHGKTTFLASIGKPFIIDTEDKCNTLETPRYVPSTLRDIEDCLKYLLECDKFPAPALAIDTLDWLEKKIHEEMCNVYAVKGVKVSNINEATHEQLNFGKGSKIAANEFNARILTLLEAIRAKYNIPIILCAQHAKVPVNLPDKDKHDIIDLRLDKTLAGYISDKVDAKLFIQLRYFKDFKNSMHPTEERYLITRPQRGVSAKNNLHLPAEVSIGEKTGWVDFISSIGTGV